LTQNYKEMCEALLEFPEAMGWGRYAHFLELHNLTLLKLTKLLNIAHTIWHACVLQGEFPDKNTQEDGYVGVAPVDAFPAQNKFGKINMYYNLR